MERLYEAIKGPHELAIVKVPGHSKANTMMAKGNERADALAKEVAGYTPKGEMMLATTAVVWDGEPPDLPVAPEVTLEDIMDAQGKSSPEQKSMWIASKAVRRSDGLWVGPRGQPVLPEGQLMTSVLTEAHTVAHVGPQAMLLKLRQWWHPRLQEVVWQFVATCELCQAFNARPTLKPKPGAFSPVAWPGAEIVIDFTDMIDRVNGKRFLLVIVDSYSRWPEAYPCAREDTTSVIKALVNHYIPTHGFPALIRSDNGTHFNNKAMAKVEALLGLKHRFGCVYHPQSQGKVERVNRNLKEKLAKIMAQTKMTWLQALPLALLVVRQTVHKITGFAPFELLTGRLMPGPASTLVPPADVPTPDLSHAAYWKYLHSLVSSVSAQVADKAVADSSSASPESDITPYVYLRVLSRKWTEPRWKGPFRVLARTSHAVQLETKGQKWYHYSQLRPAPDFVPANEVMERKENE
ncbi:protein NYNRIN-like [Vanacampus margaritifer]